MSFLIILGILGASGWLLAVQQMARAARASARAAECEELAERAQAKSASRKKELTRLRAAMGALEKLTEEARAGFVELKGDRDKQAQLAQERFELIEGVIQEKLIVWRMYRDSTRQAGVAQNWLLREYSSALVALNHYRKKAGQPEVKVPAQLAELVAEFTANAQSVPDSPPAGGPAEPAPGSVAEPG